MKKERNKELQENQKSKSNERQDQVKNSMYVEFADDFLDLNPDHCLNSNNAKRGK